MADLEVPRWLLRKLVYSSGFRLDKAVRFKEIEVSRPVHSNIIKSKGKDGPFQSDRHRFVINDPVMGFETWEYRFWGVEVKNDKPAMATCRLCQVMQFSAMGRKRHIKDKQCTTKLIRVYAMLLKDEKCVICDSLTHSTKWGVPLCDRGRCIDLWMHDEACPTALENAIMLADKQGIIEDVT